jgi:hypothetical protein
VLVVAGHTGNFHHAGTVVRTHRLEDKGIASSAKELADGEALPSSIVGHLCEVGMSRDRQRCECCHGC